MDERIEIGHDTTNRLAFCLLTKKEVLATMTLTEAMPKVEVQLIFWRRERRGSMVESIIREWGGRSRRGGALRKVRTPRAGCWVTPRRREPRIGP